MRVPIGGRFAVAAVLLALTLGHTGCSPEQGLSGAPVEPAPPQSNYTVHTRPGIELVAYQYSAPTNDRTRTGNTIELWTADRSRLATVDGMAAAIAPDGVYYRTQVDRSTTGEIRFLGSDGTSRVVGPNPNGGQWVMAASPSGRRLFLQPGWIVDTENGVARRVLANTDVEEADWVDDETLVAGVGRRGLALVRGDVVSYIEGTADADSPSANGRLIAYWTPTYPLNTLIETRPIDMNKARSRTLAILDLDDPAASRVLTEVVAPVRGHASWLDDDTLSVSKSMGGGQVLTERVELD